MQSFTEIRRARLQKLEDLKNRGINPYPASSHRTHTIGEVLENFETLAREGKEVVLAGRIRLLREHGKSCFFNFEDFSGKIQAYLKIDEVGEEKYRLFLKDFDIGDFIEVRGVLFLTKKGERTLLVKDFRMLAKSLRPLPDKWHGLKDVEERYRKRYLDLLVNPQVREVFLIRSKVIKIIRHFLEKEGFIEVETPVLQPIYGGASARPFITHHNALDIDLYLRIAPELYLKRLIVGGFEKVFEIARNFRNEGIDRQHNPEFTMLEFYWAYADYEDLMRLTERMLQTVLQEVKGGTKIEYEGKELDFTPPLARTSFRDLVLEYTGIDIDVADTEEKLLDEIKKKGIELDLEGVVGFGALADELYKRKVRPHLLQPQFVIDYPALMLPLAKRKEDDPRYCASFQLLVMGFEVIKAYNELNDPIDQKERWEEELRLAKKGLEEYQVLDEDFIEALEYGMPPTAGWGMGIDRFVALLTGQHSIKDTILFPTLRPKK